MKEERITGSWLRHAEDPRGHLWHGYSVMINQVIMAIDTFQWPAMSADMNTGTRIPDPPFSSFGPSRDYGMDLCLEVYLWSSLSHLSIFYNISCYNSLVLLTFVSRPSCRFTYNFIYVFYNPIEHVWNCIGRKVNQRNPQCQNIVELTNTIM